MKLMKQILFVLGMILIFASCNSGSQQEKTEDNYEDALQGMTTKSSSKQAVVLESMEAGTYTYVKLKSDGREFWAAITARPVEEGKTYYYNESILMKDFESKQLEKTFDSVLFIQDFSETPMDSPEVAATSPHDHSSAGQREDIHIETGGEAISLEQLFKNKISYEGEEVTVKGQVVKINKNIMQRNWIHIQDGTSHEGAYDLTITTTGPVEFRVNDVVTFKGTLDLDKDFGSGYFYPVIVENAKVIEHKGQAF